MQRYREFGCAGQGSKVQAMSLSVMVEKYRKGELAQAVV
jgi:fructose-bisphosphate aldolase class II